MFFFRSFSRFVLLILFLEASLLFSEPLFAQVAATPVTPPVATPATTPAATPATAAEPASEEKQADDDADEDQVAEKDAEEEAEEAPKPKPKRRRPVRAKVPKGVFGTEKEKSPENEETILGGTVPAIWEIEQKSFLEDDDLSSILDRGSIAPAVPGKVVRYAVWLMQQYDSNGDGCLQEAEWKKMSGSPQAIDLDGDHAVSLDELVRFLALYGKNRTIHRPDPIEKYHQPRMISSQFQLFKPLTTVPDKQETRPSQEATAAGNELQTNGPQDELDPEKDLTDEALEAKETVVDDATYEEIIAGRQVPAEKKYHTPKEVLYGVPAWFVIRDRNGDGQISLLEFAPSMTPQALALFGRLDKNGDGLITPDEVRIQPPPAQATPPTPPSATPSTAVP